MSGEIALLRSITQEFAVKRMYDLKIVYGKVVSDNGAGGAATVNMDIIPWKKWRAVAAGFIVNNLAATTKKQIVEIGHRISDIGAEDLDAFLTVTMDVTDGDQWVAGDGKCFVYPEVLGLEEGRVTEAAYHLDDADAEAGAGILSSQLGDLMGRWQTDQVLLCVTMTGEVGSTATVIPFLVIEVLDLYRRRY